MSSSATTSKTGATFLWVLGAFASFAVLFLIIQAFVGERGYVDPRADTRSAQREEVAQAQLGILAKMGLQDSAKREALFASTIKTLEAKKPGVSTQLVPGSPTQLKQAAAAAAATPAPAPAAPAAPGAPAPAVPAAPSAPAPAAPAPAAPSAGPAPATPAAPAPAN
ncbi:MAG TPA: hypothetical protein VD994_16525 [Prosthecobacter sp.]|nr:hypothetical protein [Prosthecobacter sp.]